MTRSRMIAAVCLAVAPALFSQQINENASDDLWQLVVHSGDIVSAGALIDAYWSDGFTPIGIEATDENASHILFVRDPGMNVRGWDVTEHTNWNELETDITETIARGYLPVDISRTSIGLHVLWLESSLSIEGWRIHAATTTPTSRRETIRKFQTEEFQLWGISSHEGLDWFLFLRSTDAVPHTSVVQLARDPALVLETMNDATARGCQPRGLGMDGEGYVVACHE